MTSGNIIPLPKPDPKPDKRWRKSKYANIRTYIPSGVHFLHASVHGRLVRESLKTTLITIAQTRRDERLAELRQAKRTSGEATFKELIEAFLEATEANPDLKPSSKLYRRETVLIIRKVWPELDGLSPQKVRQDEVAAFAGRLRKRYSPTRYNGTLETLRAIFQIGIENGTVGANPVVFANRKKGIKGIPRAKIAPKDWNLPDPTEFKTLLARLEFLPSRLRASRVVRFLAFSGLRIGAARKVMPSDVDLTGNFLTKPPLKYSDTPKRLPMFKELRKVCEELLADYPGSNGPLLPIANPRKALKHACIECGIEPLTNHALRKLFTTRCLESGVDVRCVAGWLDHRDNGALLLRVYSHLVDRHSKAMAEKVKF